MLNRGLLQEPKDSKNLNYSINEHISLIFGVADWIQQESVKFLGRDDYHYDYHNLYQFYFHFLIILTSGMKNLAALEETSRHLL